MDSLVAESLLVRHRHTPSPRRSSHVDGIPRLTRSLAQVASDSNRLLSARVASTSTQDTSQTVFPAALRLFARGGFDADHLRRAINNVEASASFVDIPLRTSGSHTYLASVAPRALDESRLQTNAEIRDYTTNMMEAELKEANKRLLEKLRSVVDVGPKRGDASTPLSSKRMRMIDGEAVAMAVDIRYVNVAREIALQGAGPSAPTIMHNTACEMNEAQHLIETFAVVASVARYTRAKPTEDVMVWGARVVLEDQFAERMGGLPSKPRLATDAVVIPAVTNFVKELMKTGQLRDHQRRERHVPLWPRVFYCLRIGHVDAAASILRNERERNGEAAILLKYIQTFIKGKEEGQSRLENTRASEIERHRMHEAESGLEYGFPMSPGYLCDANDYNELEVLYREVAWVSGGPYMRACIVLLLRLELSESYNTPSDVQSAGRSMSDVSQYPTGTKHAKFSVPLADADMSLLFGSVEDYLWLRLWLCRTPAESSAVLPVPNVSYVRLQGLQSSILDCGNSHFDPNNRQPLLFPFVLTCCGLYEEAVAYLTSHSSHQFMHAGIHLGIVLYHAGWISHESEFHELVVRFVDSFARMFPREAAIYLLTLRDKKVVCEAMRDLVLKTGEYALLLGEGKDAGILGNLVQEASGRLPTKLTLDDMREIRKETNVFGASQAEARGEFTTAVVLYKAAGEISKSIEMSMKSLAEIVHVKSSSRRSVAIAETGAQFQLIEKGKVNGISDVVKNTLEALLRMASVFQDFWTGRYYTAWIMLREVDFIPFSFSDADRHNVQMTISQKYHACLKVPSKELLKSALVIAEHSLLNGLVWGLPARSASAIATPNAQGLNPTFPRVHEIRSVCMYAGLERVSDSTVNEALVRIELLMS